MDEIYPKSSDRQVEQEDMNVQPCLAALPTFAVDRREAIRRKYRI